VLNPTEGFTLREIETTADVAIPADPLARVIGQGEAVNLARLAAMQRRHFLLVGPPGTGKSMIAQALALHMPPPDEELRVVHNPENPERPLVEVKKRDEVAKEDIQREGAEGDLIDPKEAPVNVAERLGFKCVNCGTYSSPRDRVCPKCARPKTAVQGNAAQNPFGDLLGGIFEVTFGQLGGRDRVTTTRRQFGNEEVVVYERAGEMVRVLDQKALEKRREMEKTSPRKVLVVGCIHGDECQGIKITQRLARGARPQGIDLWIVHLLNPDGHALGVRQNGRGVDLNRNFPSEWTPGGRPWDVEYPGPRPLSEPESRAAARLIRRIKPSVTIWFHQPQALVRAWGPSVPVARRYARLAGMKFRAIRWPRGTAPNWQNHRFPGTSSFVVELAPGSLSDRRAARHAYAVMRLARTLVAAAA